MLSILSLLKCIFDLPIVKREAEYKKHNSNQRRNPKHRNKRSHKAEIDGILFAKIVSNASQRLKFEKIAKRGPIVLQIGSHVGIAGH